MDIDEVFEALDEETMNEILDGSLEDDSEDGLDSVDVVKQEDAFENEFFGALYLCSGNLDDFGNVIYNKILELEKEIEELKKKIQ